MRHKTIFTRWLVFALFVVLSSSCKKQGKHHPIPDGKATAVKNGLPWNAEGISGYDNNQDNEVFIILRTYSVEGFLREDLGIIRIPLMTGKNTLIKANYDTISNRYGNYSASYATVIDDGDVLGEYYNVLETEENFINIQNIDYDKMVISGIFNATFVSSDTTSIGDTVSFSDGEFQSPIKEEW